MNAKTKKYIPISQKFKVKGYISDAMSKSLGKIMCVIQFRA